MQQMYCHGCGAQVDLSINFCKRCGLPVQKGASNVSEQLGQGVPYVGGFGLLGAIFLAIYMVRRDVPLETFGPLVVVYLATLFGICWLMLHYSYKMTARPKHQSSDEKTAMAHGLWGRDTAQLDEPRETPASVIENTTRTLEKTPIDR